MDIGIKAPANIEDALESKPEPATFDSNLDLALLNQLKQKV